MQKNIPPLGAGTPCLRGWQRYEAPSSLPCPDYPLLPTAVISWVLLVVSFPPCQPPLPACSGAEVTGHYHLLGCVAEGCFLGDASKGDEALGAVVTSLNS